MGVDGREKLNPNISGLFEPQLSQKANKINFGNRNGKNDTPHQTIWNIYRHTTNKDIADPSVKQQI